MYLNIVLQVNISAGKVEYHSVGTVACISRSKVSSGLSSWMLSAFRAACNAKYLGLTVSMTVL